MLHTLHHAAMALWLLFTRGPRVAWVTYRLLELQAYLDDCAADGLHHSLALDRWHAERDDLRVQLALLQPPLARPHPTPYDGQEPA